jgi:ubiquinone/menaquinone biosynthesis C-methylase UbiE
MADNMMLDPAMFKAQQRYLWDASAPGWWASRRTTEEAGQALNERMVQLAALGPGAQALDVGTGLGEPALTAARAVAPGGTVIGVDISPKSLEYARQRAAELGITNVSFVEGDAEQLGYAEGSFDAVLSRWAIMIFPNLVQSLAALRGMLKPGGRLVVAVWGRAPEVPLMSAPIGALARALGGLPPSPMDPFYLGDPEVLQNQLRAAGFGAVSIEQVTATFVLENADEYLANQRACNPLAGALIDRQPQERQSALWTAVKESARPFTGPDGRVRIPNASLVATATR